MALYLFHVLCFLALLLVTSYAELSPEVYWKSQLPNIEMPQSIRDLLIHPAVYAGVKPVPDRHVDAKVYNREAPSDSLIIHDDPNLAQRFFLEKDLQKGTTMTLHFTKSTNPGTFFPRMVANKIPFSSKKLPEILNRFSINPGSTEAEVMKNQINVCEEVGLQDEEKYCATSLENMVDYAKLKLGKDVKVISTKVMSIETKIIQKYKVDQGVMKINGEESKYVTCHKLNYAYAVFYCHNIKNTRAYVVPLKGEDGTQVKVVAACHTDTSHWNPKHLAFKVLRVKPGTVPICHFLPQDNIMWYNNN